MLQRQRYRICTFCFSDLLIKSRIDQAFEPLVDEKMLNLLLLNNS